MFLSVLGRCPVVNFPCALSEVLTALEFSQECDLFISLLVPAAVKTFPQHDVIITVFHDRDRIGQAMSTVCFSFQVRVESEFHQTIESCFSWHKIPFCAFWQTRSEPLCAVYSGFYLAALS